MKCKDALTMRRLTNKVQQCGGPSDKLARKGQMIEYVDNLDPSRMEDVNLDDELIDDDLQSGQLSPRLGVGDELAPNLRCTDEDLVGLDLCITWIHQEIKPTAAVKRTTCILRTADVHVVAQSTEIDPW